MNNKHLFTLYTGVALTILNTISIGNMKKDIHRIDKQGEVSVELTPIEPKKPITPVFEYKGPHLYNNHTRIIFNSQDEFECLAQNIYYEGRGEGYIGKIAIAQITLNRAMAGKWGQSFCSVVFAPKQFSWTMKKQKPPKGKEWDSARNAALMFQNGVRVTNISKTDHYHTNEVNTVWDNNMKKTATIGHHVFYASK